MEDLIMFIGGVPVKVTVTKTTSFNGVRVTCSAGLLSVTSEIHEHEDEALWQARMELRALLMANKAA